MKTYEKLGLTKHEEEIYRLLVGRGELPASFLINETKSHPQVIYRALDGLKDKLLVFEFTQNAKKYFRAEDPEVLLKREEERTKSVRDIVSNFKTLQALSKDVVVKIFRGNEEVVNMRRRAYDNLKKGETHYIIGASGDRYYQVVGDVYDSLEKKRIKRGIKRKMIAFESQRQDLVKKDLLTDGVETRFLDEAFNVPSSTNIFRDTVAILIWEYTPIIILIESSGVAESYRQYFNQLWKNAKK